MDDHALAVGRAVLDALRATQPAPVPRPAWVRLDHEAAARGYSTTRAFRSWCLKHGVAIREEPSAVGDDGLRRGTARVSWVAPAEVDAAIAGLPTAARRPGDAMDDEVDRALEMRR